MYSNFIPVPWLSVLTFIQKPSLYYGLKFQTLQLRLLEISPHLQHFLFLSPPAVDWIGSGMGGFTSVPTPSPILDDDIGVIGSSFMTVSSVKKKKYMLDKTHF